MKTDERGFDSLTERVLAAVFAVSNTLGAGFVEKVYERALLVELSSRGIRAAAQASFAVTYKGQYVGEYFADVLVEDVLVVELNVSSASPTNTPRNVSTICESPGGPSVFWSIFKGPKWSGSESSTAIRFPRQWRGCP